MKQASFLLVVDDIAASRIFYENVLSQTIIFDFGSNIVLSGGFSLQAKDVWCEFIDASEGEILKNTKNMEVFFEEENFDAFLTHLKACDGINYVHDTKEYPWGQRAVRFYDPDQHIIEVGESVESVVKKLFKEGLSVEEVAERMQHPIEFVKTSLGIA
jgi:catechol 2,3-dioxygenase-like lactoylglutathione lyase family enzyme